MEDKLRRYMDGLVVYKNLNENNFFKSINMPSFLRDFIIQRYSDDEGQLDIEEVKGFIKTYLPKKEEWQEIKNTIIHGYESVKILAKIIVDIDVHTKEVTFELPSFDLKNKETLIEELVWNECGKDMCKGDEIWGILELGYKQPEEKPKRKGRITLESFKKFEPYEVNLEYYKEIREEFTTDEWIDVILGAIDYNANGYNSEEEKLSVMKRLLPFVEKRVNMIELAPKGTGKSYLFGKISRHGWLSTGGKMSRAKMFYDIQKKKEGIIHNNDFVALDEVQTITFSDISEMRSMLKGYLEDGQYSLPTHTGVSGAGVILLGNIDKSKMDINKDMFKELPEEFRESALLDRFHGFIEGWKIPRMNDDLKVKGWAVNSEYFCTILHLLRDELDYRIIVDSLIEVPSKSDTRDTEAIKRMTTAYLKLLFPNVRTESDVDLEEFEKYCLDPAIKMRQIIKTQLAIIDSEFLGKDVPDLKVKGME